MAKNEPKFFRWPIRIVLFVLVGWLAALTWIVLDDYKICPKSSGSARAFWVSEVM